MDSASITLLGSIGTLLIGGLAAAIVKVIAALGDVKVQLLVAQATRSQVAKISDDKLTVIHDLTNSNLQQVQNELIAARTDLKSALETITSMGATIGELKETFCKKSTPTEVIVANLLNQPVPIQESAPKERDVNVTNQSTQPVPIHST